MTSWHNSVEADRRSWMELWWFKKCRVFSEFPKIGDRQTERKRVRERQRALSCLQFIQSRVLLNHKINHFWSHYPLHSSWNLYRSFYTNLPESATLAVFVRVAMHFAHKKYSKTAFVSYEFDLAAFSYSRTLIAQNHSQNAKSNEEKDRRTVQENDAHSNARDNSRQKTPIDSKPNMINNKLICIQIYRWATSNIIYRIYLDSETQPCREEWVDIIKNTERI